MFISHHLGISDISTAVVDLLQEMTDVDTLTEGQETAEEFIDTLVGILQV